MKKFYLTLDLINDVDLINEYIHWHKKVWPEVVENIKKAGINDMNIYHFKTRLFMEIEADEDFSFEKKNILDLANPKVQEWEQLMWKYQKEMPGALPGEKWMLMDPIFSLKG